MSRGGRQKSCSQVTEAEKTFDDVARNPRRLQPACRMSVRDQMEPEGPRDEAGQLTVDAKGVAQYDLCFSRIPHVPTESSGEILNRGGDRRDKTTVKTVLSRLF